MDSIIVEGNIIMAMPKRENGQWSNQQFVIEDTTGKFPVKVAFDVFGQDKIEQFDVKVGERVKVFLNINAREWNGKWFNNVQAWRVERQGGHIGGQSFNNQPKAQQPVAETQQQPQQAAKTDIDSLPF